MVEVIARRHGTPDALTRITFEAQSAVLTDSERDAIPYECSPEDFPDVAERIREAGMSVRCDWTIHAD